MDFLKEVFSCMKYLNMSYTEVMSMTTMERRFFINEHIKSNEKKREEESTVSTGKHSRVKKISGDAVKNYSGKI